MAIGTVYSMVNVFSVLEMDPVSNHWFCPSEMDRLMLKLIPESDGYLKLFEYKITNPKQVWL